MVTATATKEPDLETRKKHFVELIRLTSMQPAQLDPILPVMVHHALAQLGVLGNIEKITKVIKDRITQEKFLEQFFETYAKTFTHEEILQLIEFYKTEAMRKFLKQSMKLYHPLYEAYRKVVEDVTQELTRRKD
jgi:hypothetical protein